MLPAKYVTQICNYKKYFRERLAVSVSSSFNHLSFSCVHPRSASTCGFRVYLTFILISAHFIASETLRGV